MFILKYLENSENVCQSTVETFPTYEAAHERMVAHYNALVKIFGETVSGKTDITHVEDERCCDEMSASVRDGLDNFMWEIIEDKKYISTDDLFTVNSTTLDHEDGNFIENASCLCVGQAAAEEKMRELYKEALQSYGVEDNNAMDENGESCEGGCFSDDEAEIYIHANFQMGCLVPVKSIMKARIDPQSITQNEETQKIVFYDGLTIPVMHDNKPCSLVVEHDPEPENPRTFGCNLTEMAFFHSRYNLGDDLDAKNPMSYIAALVAARVSKEDFLKALPYPKEIPADEKGEDMDIASICEEYLTVKECEEILKEHGNICIQPAYLYDHSGLSISTSTDSFVDVQWDCSKIGWVSVTKEKIMEAFFENGYDGSWQEIAEQAIESEIRVYDSYVSGDVYGVVLKDENGDDIDSVWGFFGSQSENVDVFELFSDIHPYVEAVNS